MAVSRPASRFHGNISRDAGPAGESRLQRHRLSRNEAKGMRRSWATFDQPEASITRIPFPYLRDRGASMSGHFDSVSLFFKESTQLKKNKEHSIVFDTKTDNGIRYIVIDEHSDGWINALSASGIISLCEYTKIRLLRKADGKVHFKILDGHVMPGQVAIINEFEASRYIKKSSRLRGIHIFAEKLKKRERFYSTAKEREFIQHLGLIHYNNGTIKCSMFTEGYRNYRGMLPPGTYDILSPVHPYSRRFPEKYRMDAETAQFERVSFRLESENASGTLHMGHIARGGIAVLDVNDWEPFYRNIIRNRIDGDESADVGGGKYIGRITVS
jgi:hypothetical protein